MDSVNIGDAVIVQTCRVIGIVREVDHGRSLAWVIWPANSGMSDCIATGALDIVAPRAQIMSAMQAMQQMITSPLERSLLSAAGQGGRSEFELVERPYFTRGR